MTDNDVVMKCLVYMTSQCVDLKERVKALEMENRQLKNTNRYLRYEIDYNKWLKGNEE